MAASSAGGRSRGFFAYYREYAQTGIHAASAAALTALIGLASFVHWGFIVLGIGVYVIPPIFLYLTGEGDRVPAVVGNDTTETDNENGRSDGDDGKTDRDDTDLIGNNSSATDFDTAETASTFEGDSSDQRAADTDDRGSIAGREATTAATGTDEPADTESGWVKADTPTDQSLLDVVCSRDGAYAVGEGGVVLARTGDGWEIIIERGPTAQSNPLTGVDATEDEETVWFAGDSGVLGRYDGEQPTDHSAPADRTSTWEDVAVTCNTGEERIHLVNGSGELLQGKYDDGRVSWGDIENPGGGSSISAIAFADTDVGYLCDTNQGVYETTDGGETYENIGIEDANTDFNGVAATDSMVVVAGGDGSVFRYDGSVWTRLHASESGLSAIDLVGKTGLAVGDGGAVYELIEERWKSIETPVEADLHGIAISTDDSEQERPDIAVGTDGTVIERHG